MKIYQSDKKFLCAEKNGKNIHSQYNPEREAERFIKASIDKEPSVIILLGAGLGYIQQKVVELFPDTLLISVFYDDTLHKNCFFKNKHIISWFPSSQSSIHSFFSRNIREQAIRNLTVLEWNPSALIYRDMSDQINRSLKNIVQQLNGNILTTASFGKKWIRNMICNYLSLENYCTIEDQSSPILIASSGPTLDKSIKGIQKYRRKFRLWALPSSLKALKYHEIVPDLLISTDPGYYGSFHFRFLDSSVPVALPLTASRGLWKSKNPTVIFNQSTPFENDLFKIDKVTDLVNDSNGTVSGTALDLALGKSSDIYFSGLDLCYSDIISHVQPHSFDSLLISRTDRTNPIHSLYYHRAAGSIADFSLGIRTGRSLQTYRNWFLNKRLNRSIEIKRLNPSPVKIENMRDGVFSDFSAFPDLPEQKITSIPVASFDQRYRKIQTMLKGWERDLLEEKREDLMYFMDTESFTKGLGYKNAIEFINYLRGLYD